MPRLDHASLCELLRRLPPDELEQALRSRILCAVKLPGAELHVVCGAAARETARAQGLQVVACNETEDFVAAATAVHGHFLLERAALGLLRDMPAYSARWPLTPAQAVVLVLLWAMVCVAVPWLPADFTLAAVSACGGFFFLGVVALRLLCLLPAVSRPPEPDMSYLSEPDLPVYSVLVPLFREAGMLPQLVSALASLRYPAERLDIKLILEEEDMHTRHAVARLALDHRFEVIVVPAGQPQTKPRALNYALPFCRGAFLAIYDAEDIPEPDQLLKAARRFAALPDDVACLQAQLTFYNPDENWLARQFAAEYAVLFGLLLPVLADHRLPLPLGGTSNHFRINVLRAIGAWDAFNVTEDADLGLRLARFGYETAVLQSLTHEEANIHVRNWLLQRARWQKGFLQTWLTHIRAPWQLLQELGPAGFWTMQALTLGVFASALLYPAGVVLMLVSYSSGVLLPEAAGPLTRLLLGVNVLAFLAGHVAAAVLMRRATRHFGIACSWITLATVPLYWCLMSVACWLALWQFVTRPFHWNKTEHGLSKIDGRVRPLPSGRPPVPRRGLIQS